MKLLFDENMSPKLVDRLADLFPGSVHVQTIGLGSASDDEVWEYAKANELTIATKDDDFQSLSVARGHPPKVVQLRIGNCTTSELESEIRTCLQIIQQFANDEGLGTLILS